MIFAIWAARPLDEILQVPVPVATIEDGVDFPFSLPLDLDGGWWGKCVVRDNRAGPEGRHREDHVVEIT